MGDVYDSRLGHWEAMQRENVRSREPEQPLRGGRGGGTYDDMEARVQRLEADVAEIKGDLKKVASDVSEARITLAGQSERVGHLPTKDWVGTQFRNWIVGVGAFLSIITIASRFVGH